MALAWYALGTPPTKKTTCSPSTQVLLLVYILYLLFQLKSHSYLYASIPQRIIDEESHPGVLADLMNPSDSSSSSDESVDSAASWSTAKRLKRAVKHKIRRKSSVSSKETGPRLAGSRKASVVAGSVVDDAATGERDTGERDESVSHAHEDGVDFTAIDFGDEPAYHADDDTVPSNAVGQRPTKLKRAKVKTDRGTRDEEPKSKIGIMEPASVSPAAPSPPRPSLMSYARRGRNHEHLTDDVLRRSSLRPAIPSLLSNTVFSNPPASRSPSTRPGRLLYRSNSLPTFRSRTPPVGNAVQFARGAAALQSNSQATADEPPPLHPQADMSRTAAVVMLLVSTGLVAVCAEFLVDAIPEMINSSPVSQAFIGLIILPIVSNAAEHVTAVSVAAKNKMDLAIGVSVGSSIQIGKTVPGCGVTESRCETDLLLWLQRSSSPPWWSSSAGAWAKRCPCTSRFSKPSPCSSRPLW